MSSKHGYENLSREELIARIAALEAGQSSSSSSKFLTPAEISQPRQEFVKANGKAKQKDAKVFDIRKYPSRKIALRFSYDGSEYNGLATQNHAGNEDRSDIVTVEDVLWKALCATRLVGENDTMGGVGWSRCGRTDRGVSAGGQVVALWVRSKKIDQWGERKALEEYVAAKKREQGKTSELDGFAEPEDDLVGKINGTALNSPFISTSSKADDTTARTAAQSDSEELAYVANLNAVLPSTIRIQAWSPVRSHFSSRFDCRYRHYKYFFTSGCPFVEQTMTKGPVPQLDIALMRFAAQKFLGDHDFRNFCKVDASKQIDNYRRRIDGISIDEVSPPWPRSAKTSDNGKISSNGDGFADTEKMYVLNLRGTAFLYHQVRHIVAILFLVGAKLEKPSIVDELLNVEKGAVARDRMMMRKRGLVLEDGEGIKGEIKTTLPDSTATTMSGLVASDVFALDAATTPPILDESDLNLTSAELALQDLTVYDRKPEYDMASDRPLMLWECGFKESDVQWRSGTYDGQLRTPTSEDEEIAALRGDVNSSTSTTSALLHSHWSSLAINAEMYKHFLLALPQDINQNEAGYIPASNFFSHSSSPTLEKAFVRVDGSRQPGQQGKMLISNARRIMPLGDGKFKPLQGYKGLLHANREETFQVKNDNYLHGRAKRRAAKKESNSLA